MSLVNGKAKGLLLSKSNTDDVGAVRLDNGNAFLLFDGDDARIYSKNTSGQTQTRPITWDQQLNTTDSVQFGNVTTTSGADLDSLATNVESLLANEVTESTCVKFDTTQSIPNGTLTVVNFNIVFTGTAFFDNAFTIPADGTYVFGCTVEFETAGTGGRRLYCRIQGGGSPIYDNYVSMPANASTPTRIQLIHTWWFNEGDKIEFAVYQDSGSSVNIGSTTEIQRTRAFMYRVASHDA